MFFWILLTLIGLAFLSVFSFVVLPRLYFKVYDAFFGVKERGVSKFNLSDGVSILFEPESTVKKFINKYQIFQKNGQPYKWFIGEFAQKLSSIDYSIVVYGRRNTVLRVYHVKEQNCESFTGKTLLPEETDYISLVVHRVNGKRISREPSFNRNAYLRLALFGFGVAVVLDGTLLLVTRLVAYLAGSDVQEILSFGAWAAILFVTFVGLCALPVGVAALVMLYQQHENEHLFTRIWRPVRETLLKPVKHIQKILQFIVRACLKCFCTLQNFLMRVLWLTPILKLKRFARQISFKTKSIFRKFTQKAK